MTIIIYETKFCIIKQFRIAVDPTLKSRVIVTNTLCNLEKKKKESKSKEKEKVVS